MNTLLTAILAIVGAYLAFGDKVGPVIAWIKSLLPAKPVAAGSSRDAAVAAYDTLSEYLESIGDKDCQEHLNAVWLHLARKPKAG